MRHAGPATVTVTVDVSGDTLEILVVDDGTGVPDGRSAGRGIRGMRERAALLGGELTAGSGPHGGWRVSARIPVPPGPVAPR